MDVPAPLQKGKAFAGRICAVEGCEAAARVRGWCQHHYLRWYKTGSTDHPHPEWKRFWENVRADAGGCWIWTASANQFGYGRFRLSGPRGAKKVCAHHYAFERANGPVPKGMHLDHLCRTSSCVNPGHLEVVTPGENMRRMWMWKKLKPIAEVI